MWIFLFQFIFAGIITLLFFKYRNDLNGWNKLEKKYLLSGHFNGSTTGFVAFDIHSLFGLRDKTGVVGVDDNFLYLALNLMKVPYLAADFGRPDVQGVVCGQ